MRSRPRELDVAEPRLRSRSVAGVVRAAFDRSPSGMTVADLDGRWLEVNEACCRMLGYTRAELLRSAYLDVTHRDDAAQEAIFFASAIAGGVDSLERDKRYMRKDGSAVWARVWMEVIRDRSGDPLYVVSHVDDAAKRRAEQDLVRDSEQMLRAVIDSTPAMISVKGRDHRYRLVNREFEKTFGLGSASVVGRGDTDIFPSAALETVHAREVAVLETGAHTQDAEIVDVRGRERLLLRTRFPLRDGHGRIDGICTTSTDISERPLEERVKRERLRCSELIYSALAQDRLVLHAQPIVPLASQQPDMVELLVRMRASRESEELLAPGTFLPAAERFDLITAVDEWVIDRAVEIAATGRRVTVNISAKTISDERQVDRIEALVIASGVSPTNIVFEVTETAVADNLDAAHGFAVRMRDLGCAIALDDFGVGHGSFTYLRRLPVDYLKIDMQFIRNLTTSADDRQVVQAIIGVARQFRIETIAEGIEDQDTLDEARRLGIDFGQGFLIGRPEPLRES